MRLSPGGTKVTVWPPICFVSARNGAGVAELLDHGVSTVIVTMGAASISSGISAVSVRLKPVIQMTAFPTDLIVSGGPITPINLNIAHGTTKVAIAGLPSGLTYNTVTGIISGTPNAPVTNAPITIMSKEIELSRNERT